MILSDDENLYITKGTVPKMVKQMGVQETGLYLTNCSQRLDWD